MGGDAAQGRQLRKLVQRPAPAADQPGAAAVPDLDARRDVRHAGGDRSRRRCDGSAARIDSGVVLSLCLMVAAVAPLTWNAWTRWGFASFCTLVAGAVAIDVAALRFDVPHVNFLNFAFVWLAIHQLGFAWSEGRLSPGRALCGASAVRRAWPACRVRALSGRDDRRPGRSPQQPDAADAGLAGARPRAVRLCASGSNPLGGGCSSYYPHLDERRSGLLDDHDDLPLASHRLRAR